MYLNIILFIASLSILHRAQQAFDTLKLTFGDNRCFLIQVNSYQGQTQNDCADLWSKYLRRQAKAENPSDPGSAPKTPQDFTGVTSMPAMVQVTTLETPPSGIISEEIVDHPLSPTQEPVVEAIVIKL